MLKEGDNQTMKAQVLGVAPQCPGGYVLKYFNETSQTISDNR